MKRFIRAAKAINRGFDVRLNYDAVDAVISQVEKSISKVESREDVEIIIDSFYSNSANRFFIDCNVTGQYETASGNIVNVDDSNLLDILACPTCPEIEGSYAKLPDTRLLALAVSNSNYDDAEVTFRYEDKDVNDLVSALVENLASFDQAVDASIEDAIKKHEAELERMRLLEEEKQARRLNKKLAQPVTLKNIGQVISNYRKDSNNKLTRKGNYLRYTSYEDDFVKYYDVNDIIQELASNDITLGDALADPELMLDCKDIGSYGIRNYSEEEDYVDYKNMMNSKLGF